MTEADCSRPFEESLAELEMIVRLLEEGRLPLTEALARYEAGVKCLRECFRALKTAERKIELLVGIDANGNPVTEDFEAAPESLEEKRQNRSRKRSRAPANTTLDSDSDSASGGMDTSKGLF